MPRFYVEDVNIKLDEFVDECDSQEKRELVKILAEQGYTDSRKEDISGRGSSLESEHATKCDLLASKFYSMTKEDLETLQTLYTKYA